MDYRLTVTVRVISVRSAKQSSGRAKTNRDVTFCGRCEKHHSSPPATLGFYYTLLVGLALYRSHGGESPIRRASGITRKYGPGWPLSFQGSGRKTSSVVPRAGRRALPALHGGFFYDAFRNPSDRSRRSCSISRSSSPIRASKSSTWSSRMWASTRPDCSV